MQSMSLGKSDMTNMKTEWVWDIGKSRQRVTCPNGAHDMDSMNLEKSDMTSVTKK